jgi:hypothetical protein
MPILTRQGISPELRRPHEKKYRARLRQALGHPLLTAEQQVRIKAELDQLGGPRVYDADSPAPPGAIELPS